MKKRLGIGVAVLVVAVVVALTTLRVVGFEPKDRRAGLWLAGEPVTTPVNDWSFSNAFPEIRVETRTRYLIPHSVTAQCASVDGQLYLASFYMGGPRRSWNVNILRDPRVRLKIGTQLFERKLIPVTDPTEEQRALDAYAKKYPSWKKISEQPLSKRPQIFYFRSEPV